MDAWFTGTSFCRNGGKHGLSETIRIVFEKAAGEKKVKKLVFQPVFRLLLSASKSLSRDKCKPQEVFDRTGTIKDK
jgi:hypothetical protein